MQEIWAQGEQSVANDLIGPTDFRMHVAKLLLHAHVLGRSDQIEIGSQRFQRTERLP
jgi:hypothetical protein